MQSGSLSLPTNVMFLARRAARGDLARIEIERDVAEAACDEVRAYSHAHFFIMGDLPTKALNGRSERRTYAVARVCPSTRSNSSPSPSAMINSAIGRPCAILSA